MSNPNCAATTSTNTISYDDWWGSLNSFYSIASAVIDNMQSSPSDSKKYGLYQAMNMQMGYGNAEIIDATSNQFGLYFLQGVGTVFCIIILVIAIFFTCGLKCCRRCTRSLESAPPSKAEQFITLFVQFVVYIICFAFILTGTIIYGISVSNFISAINSENVDIQYNEYLTNRTAREGADQLQCAYNDMLRTLSSLPQQTSLEPTNLINIWRGSSGLTNSLNVDTPDILTQFIPQAMAYGETAKANLTTLKSHPSFVKDAGAQNEIQGMIDQINIANGRMNDLLPPLPQLREETVRVLTKANTTENNLRNSMWVSNTNLFIRLNASDGLVLKTLHTISSAGYESARWSNQLWTTILTKMNNAYNWGGLSAIKAAAIISVVLPASILLLFLFISIFICLFKICAAFLPSVDRKVGVKRHGRYGANFIRGGFYFAIWFGIVPFMVSIALIWYAQLYAGTCFDLYDVTGRSKFYHDVHYEDMNVLTYDGRLSTIGYNDFLVLSDSTYATMFTALSSQNILISSADIPRYVDVERTRMEIDDLIARTDLAGGFDSKMALNFSQLDQALNISTIYFETAFANGFLPYCTSLDQKATFAVNSELAQYTIFYLSSAQSFADNEATSTTKASADSQTQTQVLMNEETIQFYSNYFNGYVNSASSNLLNRLNSNAYMAYPVYVNYAKSGEMLCDYLRRPLNGLWAAAGMIGIFWIPAAICLFFTSNFLYRVHKPKVPQQIAQSVVVTPAVTTQSVLVESPSHTTVASAPAVVMATTPVVTSTTSPALYPVIGNENLAIIEQ